MGKPPLRVLFVIPGEDSGSSMIFARRLLTHLERHVDAADAFFLASRTDPIAIIREWRRLRDRIEVFHPTILHAQYGTMTGLVTCFSSGAPKVVTFRGSDVNPSVGSPLRSYFGRALSAIAAIRADAIICVSEEIRRRTTRVRRGGSISVIPSGVDTQGFRPMDRLNARQVLGWNPDQPVVLFNGSNPLVKRLDLASAAVLAAQSRLASKLRFEVMTGDVDVDRVPVLMNGSDCLLMTSDHEGSPTIVQEAIACGLPVVSVDVGDVRENLRGVLPSAIVPREAEAIGSALADLLARPTRSNGALMAERFSFDNIAERVVKIYAELTVSSKSQLA